MQFDSAELKQVHENDFVTIFEGHYEGKRIVLFCHKDGTKSITVSDGPKLIVDFKLPESI